MDEKGNANIDERLTAIELTEARIMKRRKTYMTIIALLICVVILLLVVVLQLYTQCGR